MEISTLKGKEKPLSLPAKDTDVRIECLRLAVATEKGSDNALKVAASYYQWVNGGK